MNDRAIAMDRCVKGWELLRCGVRAARGRPLTPALSRRERGSDLFPAPNRGSVRVCARAVDRTRPHPDPLPAGEGV